MKTKTTFSFYNPPITNVKPYRNITLAEAHKVITGKYIQDKTQQLRSIADKQANRVFKATHFPYCTFSGTFNQRSEDSLIKHSTYLALDFDNLKDVQSVKMQLLTDSFFETELLFVSPNGNGLKWIVSIDTNGKFSHADYFQAIYNYIRETYSIEIDRTGRDVARAAFLCYDPEAFIHSKYLVS